MPSRKAVSNAMEIDRLATQLAKDPHSKAFLPLAEEYCKVGMWEEAVSVLEPGLKYYPGFITAMVVLGRAYHQLGQPTKAKTVLEGAVKLSPDNLRAHRILMKIYTAQASTQEAMASCRAILAMNPKDEEALALQASLNAQGGSPADETAVLSHQPPAPAVTSDAAEVTLPVEDGSVSPDKPPFAAPAIDGDRVEAAAAGEGRVRHAEAIAQLESWLRSLQQHRRDRPTQETARLQP